MRADTLTYRYFYQASPQKLFQTLLDQQLKYFQAHDAKIKNLHVGDEIQTTLKTKLQKLDSVIRMKITKIDPGREFQLQTLQSHNHTITQTFKFEKSPNGRNQLLYSEQTNVQTVRGQSYFFLAALLYKFFYNRGMKKRLQYLDQLALS
ncbi:MULTISPECIES: DUF3284 domain-containing protein [Lactobacillus]|uniref:DUF3284 domain-containing protein n=1 Tax=Lactobacillus xujianguonis TaxID=2495899 RepID=A0A437SSP0_9LACO|nr:MULTISPECIES: DUF3284 domain-containing protein [Lactobacillus]RVU69979.1 DUF3284 domain-containing protein [Lactobacillus xujianguonis]RVU72359.1 DUF3284 domain-containing protein [Lactobacillus xujianguonis]